MKLTGPERFKLTFDAKKCAAKFSSRANTKIPKLYVVVADGEVIYVGIALRAMRERLYGGWNASGKHGYHGYAWRHTHTEADIHVWCQEDPQADSLLDLETVEAEVVFLVRSAGQWPRGQTEIHFHPSEKEHRVSKQNPEELRYADLGSGVGQPHMRILPTWLRESVNITADDRQLAHEFLLYNACDKTSAVGAKELSPALQRWVRVLFSSESRRDGRGKRLCRAYGTPSSLRAHPALKRWAKLCRPASGTAAFAFIALFRSRNDNRNSAFLTELPKGLA